MHLKGGSVALLGCQQTSQVSANLTYLAIGARNIDSITPCRARCSSYEVIILVGRWPARADLRCDVLVAEESHVAIVADWLVGKHIWLICIGAGADVVSFRTVNSDTYVSSACLVRIVLHFLCLWRVGAKSDW